MKNHWIEGLAGGIASFLVIWVAMLAEIRLGLIVVEVPFIEYMFSSFFSAVMLGALVGLLFAYAQKYILFDKYVMRGIAFLALFEVLCIAVMMVVSSRFSDMMSMYSSTFAFLFDVVVTVVLGGYVIGTVYEYLLRKKVVSKLKRPTWLLMVVFVSVFSAFFSLSEFALGLTAEVGLLVAAVSMLLVMVSAGLYYFRRWGLYAALAVYITDVLFASVLLYHGDFSLLPMALMSVSIVYYLFSNRKIFVK